MKNSLSSFDENFIEIFTVLIKRLFTVYDSKDCKSLLFCYAASSEPAKIKAN